MIEILKKIINRFRNSKIKRINYTKRGIQPMRDWHIILVLTFILICLMAIVAYYLYFQIDKGKLFSLDENISVQPIMINDELMNKTLEEIKLRENNLNEFKQNGIIPTDPSL